MRVLSSSTAAALALVVASSPSTATAKTLAEYEHEFAHWMTQHGLSFANDALEYARRLETYITNDLFINRHNAANQYSFTLAHNAFSHLTFDEFKQRYMGLKLSPAYVQQRLSQKPNGRLQHVQAPKAVDWVAKGGVTPVKNQGMCGSCWAFSTTGAVEGAAYVASGKLVSLAEQELVDCDDNGDMGCNGGLMDHAFAWIENHKGLCREEAYPYVAKQGVCKQCDAIVRVTGFQDVDPNDESQLKAAVSQQPVSVAIEADQKEFQFYKSGVFDKTCGTMLDHGVLAVGYGEESGAKFWKVKNSWGDKWGENGYIRLSREAGSAHGQCGIAMVPSYPFAAVIQDEYKNTTTVNAMTATKTTVSGATTKGSSAKISQCGDKETSLVVFDDLEIAPTAPKRGKPVTFFGKGSVKKGFETAGFQLDVRLAGERVFGHKGKICGETHVPLPLGLGHIDVHGFQCPVGVGKFSDLKVDVNLPKIAPAGDYEIHFTAGDNAELADNLFCVHVELDLTNNEEAEEDAAKPKVYEPLTAVM